MKAKKLPSGSWRCQPFINGIRKSFIVKDPSLKGKRKCEAMAANWANTIRSFENKETVSGSIRDYIDSKANILSPSTIRSYEGMLSNSYESIKDKKIDSIQGKELQKWMDDFSKTHSAKSCANARSLLVASLKMAMPEFAVKITIKQHRQIEYYTPTDADISAIIEHTKGTEIGKAIMLAAFGTLRRGEICALTKDDISGNKVHICKSMAQVKGGKYIIKSTKNEQSVRTVELPREVIKALLDTEGNRIVNMTPSSVTQRFEHVLKECYLPSFRFHDLRAYSASVRHAMGIPDVYIMADGGWKTDNVLKRVYRRAMNDKRSEFARTINGHFTSIIAHEIAHDDK